MNKAHITWVSGPLLKARTLQPFALYDAVHIGPDGLLGEVIRIDGTTITVQVYEDTTGLALGDQVSSQGLALAVPLGPGILGGIFDGLLRPLGGSQSAFVARGLSAKRNQQFLFTPQVEVGTKLSGGAVLGTATRAGVPEQQVLVPPTLAGAVLQINKTGEVDEDTSVCTLVDAQDQSHEISMLQIWPVRQARPVLRRLPVDEPLITGQRILDSLFPVGLGGKATIPGGFGTGKTVLLETLARWCNADVIVFVGCGERGNEMTSMLEEFPQLIDPRNQQRLMQRTVIIANASNMPVAAREASIYTAITVAEHFRDQGLHVVLLADSTSRWAEALREISGRLGELPGEAGYPAYLSTRLAEFYERAAKVQTLSNRQGSVTILGTVSPPAGDFSEPVVAHTKRYVRCFWALDAQRAQARFYPAIHPLQSYSEDAAALAPWWRAQGAANWIELRRQVLSLLEEQIRLQRMARIIGKDALPYHQQVLLLCAELVNEAFLRQSAYSEIDRYASPKRQAAMLSLLGRFIERANAAVDAGVEPDALAQTPLFRRLQRMGEDIGDDALAEFERLTTELEDTFQALTNAVPSVPNSESERERHG